MVDSLLAHQHCYTVPYGIQHIKTGFSGERVKHCRITLKILPERQFRLNETSNPLIQGEGGGRGLGRPLAVGMNQHTA